MLPMRSHLSLFLFFMLPYTDLFRFEFTSGKQPFLTTRFFIPRRGELACSPSWSQFDSLSVLYLSGHYFIDFHLPRGNRVF